MLVNQGRWDQLVNEQRDAQQSRDVTGLLEDVLGELRQIKAMLAAAWVVTLALGAAVWARAAS